MALGPRTPMGFLVFATLYNLVIGCCYGAFGALTLEAIGKGAAATKYNVFASLANIPTAYLAAVEGWARTHHGVNAFLYVDFAAPIAGALIFGMVLMVANSRRPRTLEVRVT